MRQANAGDCVACVGWDWHGRLVDSDCYCVLASADAQVYGHRWLLFSIFGLLLPSGADMRLSDSGSSTLRVTSRAISLTDALNAGGPAAT
jgi:hypothetical protein